MDCRCGHGEEKHYGTEDRQCNALACACLGFVKAEAKKVEPVLVEAPVISEPPKKKPGRPKGS